MNVLENPSVQKVHLYYCFGIFVIYVGWNLQQTLAYATREIAATIVTRCKHISFKGKHA